MTSSSEHGSTTAPGASAPGAAPADEGVEVLDAEVMAPGAGSSPTGPDAPPPAQGAPGDGSPPTAPDAPDQDAAAPMHEDIDELVDTARQRDEYLALAQRTQADFENYRKRMAREASAAEVRGVIKLARDLLPALDNLARALEAAAEDDPLLAGVRLVHSELSTALARRGIEPFSPQGERFDPVEHEAMAQQPVEGTPPGTVVEVYQPGYRGHGTIIRPARVVVAA